MSNHNLFTLSADGAVVPASSEAILISARRVLAHRVRRGAWLQSPQKTGDYLMARLGHLDYEVFGLILLDKRGPGERSVRRHSEAVGVQSAHPNPGNHCHPRGRQDEFGLVGLGSRAGGLTGMGGGAAASPPFFEPVGGERGKGRGTERDKWGGAIFDECAVVVRFWTHAG